MGEQLGNGHRAWELRGLAIELDQHVLSVIG
jgi:hypothetical protein